MHGPCSMVYVHCTYNVYAKVGPKKKSHLTRSKMFVGPFYDSPQSIFAIVETSSFMDFFGKKPIFVWEKISILEIVPKKNIGRKPSVDSENLYDYTGSEFFRVIDDGFRCDFHSYRHNYGIFCPILDIKTTLAKC